MLVRYDPLLAKFRFWWRDRRLPVAIGRNGITVAKREGDGATPIGTLPIRRVLYRADRIEPPQTRLPVEEIRPEHGWCDEPENPFYNRPVDLPFPAHHERLWRDDHVYDLIAVLGWNDAPVVPGRGSAIFLHVARPDFAGTEGCIALAMDDLRGVLADAGPGDTLTISARF
ncbi:L,D-transpeptidase family protein [Tistrella bauzanensis]|uniref:L,D-transpeptidase family protein n=1 Tax=Tistrella arctica TaxID=3133430 RepID=A0ABU9YGP1_9PROT